MNILHFAKTISGKLKTRLLRTELPKPTPYVFDTNIHLLARQALENSLSMEKELASELAETRNVATSIMESLVKRSEAERHRLELIFDSLGDAVLLINAGSMSVEAANSMARKMFNMQTSELLKSSVETLLNGAYLNSELVSEFESYKQYLLDVGYDHGSDDTDYQRLRLLYSNYVRTEQTLIGAYRDFAFIKPDGTLTQARAVLNLVTLDPFDKDFGYIAVIQDITDVRRVESEVARLQSFTSSLMSVTQVPMFNKDAKLRFTFVNSPFRDMVQLDDDGIIGKSASHVFDEESANLLTALDHRALQSTEAQQSDFTMRTQAGKVRGVRVCTQAIRHGEKVSGVTGSIIVKSNIDEAARSSVFEAAAKAIVFFDACLIATGCNDEFLRLSELEKSQVIGISGYADSLQQFMPADPRVHASDIITLRNKQFCRVCSPVISPDKVYEGLVCVYFLNSVQG